MKFVKPLLAVALTTLSLAACAATRGTSPKGLEAPIEKATLKFAADVRTGGYRVVDTAELKGWIDSGKKMVVISTLPAIEDTQFGTLPAAVNGAMPKTEKELTAADRETLLKTAGPDKDTILVVYCGFLACRRSHIGAMVLVENGYKNVYRYPGGIAAWQEKGYPLTK
jgi:rhodanese-related sulfurtransferase